MLEFLVFLNVHEKKILELIKQANYEVEENTPLCLIGDEFFGFLKKPQKRVVICTENAKKYGGYNFANSPKSGSAFQTGLMIRRALRHEAVHIAQECNNGEAMNIVKKENIKISPHKLKALKGSTSLTGDYEGEYEAYTLEDRPRKIISLLKEFCF